MRGTRMLRFSSSSFSALVSASAPYGYKYGLEVGLETATVPTAILLYDRCCTALRSMSCTVAFPVMLCCILCCLLRRLPCKAAQASYCRRRGERPAITRTTTTTSCLLATPCACHAESKASKPCVWTCEAVCMGGTSVLADTKQREYGRRPADIP